MTDRNSDDECNLDFDMDAIEKEMEKKKSDVIEKKEEIEKENHVEEEKIENEIKNDELKEKTENENVVVVDDKDEENEGHVQETKTEKRLEFIQDHTKRVKIYNERKKTLENKEKELNILCGISSLKFSTTLSPGEFTLMSTNGLMSEFLKKTEIKKTLMESFENFVNEMPLEQQKILSSKKRKRQHLSVHDEGNCIEITVDKIQKQNNETESISENSVDGDDNAKKELKFFESDENNGNTDINILKLEFQELDNIPPSKKLKTKSNKKSKSKTTATKKRMNTRSNSKKK